MNIYKDFDEIEFNPDSVITLGTFDGVHKGHRKLISRLEEIAQTENLRPVVITIDPHPQIVLQTAARPKIQLLTSIKERIELFDKYGVEHLLIIPFSYQFSQTPPEIFVKDYLVNCIGVKKFLVGHDHSFGKNRAGNTDLIRSLAEHNNFEIEKVEPYIENGVIVSSSKIRHLLLETGVAAANQFLGYPYMVRGTVVHGNGRGSTIGYPTANIRPPDIYKLLPGNGVYLVSTVYQGNKYFGMANVGLRPTLTNDIKPTLEVNIFDFDEDIYNTKLSLYFHKFIREEKKFRHQEALVHQIELDERQCRDLMEEY